MLYTRPSQFAGISKKSLLLVGLVLQQLNKVDPLAFALAYGNEPLWLFCLSIRDGCLSVHMCVDVVHHRLHGCRLQLCKNVLCALQDTMSSYVGTTQTQTPSFCKILQLAAATSPSHQPFLRMHGKHMEPMRTCSLSPWLKGRLRLQTYTRSRSMARPLFVSGVVVRPPR